MKIAISSTGQNLDASVDARFGRCQYFIIIEPGMMEFEAIANPSITATHGAGIQTSQLIASKGATVVLTGNCGPNAFQTLSAAGIQVIVGVTGTVKDAIERYKKGELQPSSQASVPSHFGTGGTSPTPGMTPGMGGGRGMGATPGTPSPMTKEQQLQSLKNQAQALGQQIDQISKRIEEIEKKGK
ncbi:MAG: dinitrogenase iron-molybdenum cofactor biosynthesis protein [Clostridia bacterium]|jgi:predicted Fe-Mo cluster-binding NifX family protein|uniref:Dinitrogenase iron-molybdenum cofactor biosynthesis domain-containing protein n=1 Tax=marine sediment metagenome TaxID=412755 RepID=X1TEW3_9ZZZZ|nr:dinitrogenase iron-molybdenum cofactor biosynthesis protein [Clostridia bacterium]